MPGNVTFRSSKTGAWRGGGSYSDSLSRGTVTTEFFGEGWEFGTVIRGGHRINVWAYRRTEPTQRIAKIMDADYRWLAVGMNDDDWLKFEPACF